jgi:hypothetical protein
MQRSFSEFLDRVSEFFASRKGLLPVIGMVLVLVNLLLQFVPGLGLVADSDFFLHLGVIVAIFGFMLSWAL